MPAFSPPRELMHYWPAADMLLPGAWPRWEPKHVLEEYDGPQIVIHEFGGVDHLGIAVDETNAFVRWVFAPITKLEFRGLIHSGETLRAALLKENVLVVDCALADLTPLHVMAMRGDQLPETALPEPGALLPRYLTALFPDAPELASPHFDIQSVMGEGVPFGDLAAITSETQSIWGTIAQSMNISEGRLIARAGGIGSLRVYVEADSDQFERIAKIYREITLAMDDPRNLARKIQEYNRVPIAAFAKYLNTVRKHQVDVLAKWQEQSALIGPESANRAAKTILPEAIPLARTTARAIAGDVPAPAIRQFHGYFENFWRGKNSGRFEFYDLDTAQGFRGTLSKDLVRQIRPDEFSLALGRGTLQRYEITVTIEYVSDERQRFILEDYRALKVP